MDKLLMLEASAPEPEERREDEYRGEAGGGWIDPDDRVRTRARPTVLLALDRDAGSD